MGGPERISGWKAIGAHLGRDRSTVIRWAHERGLPVHFVPGGGAKKTVYANRAELDAWLARSAETAPASPPPPPSSPRSRRRRWLAWAGGAAAALLILGAIIGRHGDAVSDPALPREAKVAALYIQGRDHWAQRDAASLAAAIAEFETVVRSDPTFAPAFSALADAYLLAREFGSLPDALAFDRARRAAEQALAIEPDLAAAHRALGFVAYWRTHDRTLTGSAFHRALTLDPDDGQTHFWYGNILADNGEHAAARRELDFARLASPGSIAIETDYAWALWSAGETDAAFARLRSVVARNPNFAAAHDCLAQMHLAERRYPDYLRAMRARARARSEAGLAERVATYERALRSGGGAALHAALLVDALRAEEGAAFPDHAYAAFVASVGDDRAALLRVLDMAERRHEIWGSAGYTARIVRRWRTDGQIAALLARRRPPPIANLA